MQWKYNRKGTESDLISHKTTVSEHHMLCSLPPFAHSGSIFVYNGTYIYKYVHRLIIYMNLCLPRVLFWMNF